MTSAPVAGAGEGQPVRAPGESQPAASEKKTHPFKDSLAVSVITFSLALLGAFTGTLTFVRSIAVDVVASARYGPNQRPESLEVSLVNTSERGVNLVSGQLLVGEQVLASLSRWLPSVPEVSDSRPEGEIFAGAQPLPFAVAPGQSSVGTAIFSPPSGERRDIDLWNKVLRQGIPDLEDPSSVRLALQFQPRHSVTVDVVAPSGAIPGRELLDTGYAPGWHSLLNYDKDGRVSAIMLGGSSRAAVGTLTLWKEKDSRPLFVAQRPLADSGWGDFRLPRLGDGTYAWAFEVAGETVGVGEVGVPCPRAFYDQSGLKYPPRSSGVDECNPNR